MEREILMMLDHPFILKLVCAFQDDYDVYFLLELLIGGELFSHLRRCWSLRRAVGQILRGWRRAGFEHMHAKKVAYRDLKPENFSVRQPRLRQVGRLGPPAKVVPPERRGPCVVRPTIWRRKSF